MMNNLRAIRKKRGMTQEALSQAARINRVTIAKYETGKCSPSLNNAARLTHALDIPLDALIQPREDGKTA